MLVSKVSMNVSQCLANHGCHEWGQRRGSSQAPVPISRNMGMALLCCMKLSGLGVPGIGVSSSFGEHVHDRACLHLCGGRRVMAGGEAGGRGAAHAGPADQPSVLESAVRVVQLS